MSNTEFRIACTPPDYDDVGAILEHMGFSYKIYTINELSSPQTMEEIDILFINCQGPEPTWQAANNVRMFVEEGGTLYVSCYARKWIDLVFPGKIEFHGDGEIQENLPVKIVDPELREFLGVSHLTLNMNTHWHGIKKILVRDGREAVKEYMRGIRQGWYEEEPMLVSFPYGKGFVIFTSFHNSHQVGELEYRLLQYLVLRPIMAAKASEANELIVTRRYTPTKEVLGALQPGEQTYLYQFFIHEPMDLKFIFNWQGKAVGRIIIKDPTGSIYVDEKVRDAPVEYNIDNAMAGAWGFKLLIVDAPMKLFPFVIHVGIKKIVEQKIEKEAPTEMFSRPSNISLSTSSSMALGTSNNLQSEAIENSQEEEYYSEASHGAFPSPYKLNNNPPLEQKEMTESPTSNTDEMIKAEPEKKESQKDARMLTFELLEPLRTILFKINLHPGETFNFTSDHLPSTVRESLRWGGLTLTLFSIQTLKTGQIVVKHTSDLEIEAAHFTNYPYKTLPLLRNIPVAYYPPVIVRIKKIVLVGIY